MGASEYITIAVGVGILGFLWALHRDMRGLGERVARLEGTIETLNDILARREAP